MDPVCPVIGSLWSGIAVNGANASKVSLEKIWEFSQLRRGGVIFKFPLEIGGLSHGNDQCDKVIYS